MEHLSMTINVTIKDIANTFRKNGYIMSDCGFMQYNDDLSIFEEVSDYEVLSIFQRIYPNFERRILKVEMIQEHLPVVSDAEFSTYDFCKEALKNKPNEDKLNYEIKKIVEYNDSRKKELPGVIPGSDYDSCIQHMINNDIYTDCNILFKYNDGDFEAFSHLNMPNLFKNIITDKMSMDNYMRIVYIGLNELTYINDIKEDLDYKHRLENIGNESWRTYAKIKELTQSIKGEKG